MKDCQAQFIWHSLQHHISDVALKATKTTKSYYYV